MPKTMTRPYGQRTLASLLAIAGVALAFALAPPAANAEGEAWIGDSTYLRFDPPKNFGRRCVNDRARPIWLKQGLYLWKASSYHWARPNRRSTVTRRIWLLPGTYYWSSCLTAMAHHYLHTSALYNPDTGLSELFQAERGGRHGTYKYESTLRWVGP